MDPETSADHSKPSPKKKRQATYLPDDVKISEMLPRFRSSKETPEINLPMLKLAFRDLIEHVKAGHALSYRLHSIATGTYGRYTIDLFHQLRGSSFDAHIDIIDQFKIISVMMLNLREGNIDSVYPKVEWNNELIDLREQLVVEIEEIMTLLQPTEELDTQEGSA